MQYCMYRSRLAWLVHSHVIRTLVTSSVRSRRALPPRPLIPDEDVRHVFLKGTGPGGQKINKTNSAAQITHIPTGIVVKSQATRSQSQNYKIARQILADKIELLEKGSESRAAVKVEVMRKRKGSKTKKSRRKYRALDEGKKGDTQEGSIVEKHEEEFKGTGGLSDDKVGRQA